jgi:hypothetical protein
MGRYDKACKIANVYNIEVRVAIGKRHAPAAAHITTVSRLAARVIPV